MVELKSAAEIAVMREAGRVVAQTLAAVAGAAAAGVRLSELDDLAAEVIARSGAKPSFPDTVIDLASAPSSTCTGLSCRGVHQVKKFKRRMPVTG